MKVNYRDYYYKYKALKYYFKNNSIENLKQIKGGTFFGYDYFGRDYYAGQIANLTNISNKNKFNTILGKLEGKVKCYVKMMI